MVEDDLEVNRDIVKESWHIPGAAIVVYSLDNFLALSSPFQKLAIES